MIKWNYLPLVQELMIQYRTIINKLTIFIHSLSLILHFMNSEANMSFIKNEQKRKKEKEIKKQQLFLYKFWLSSIRYCI